LITFGKCSPGVVPEFALLRLAAKPALSLAQLGRSAIASIGKNCPCAPIKYFRGFKKKIERCHRQDIFVGRSLEGAPVPESGQSKARFCFKSHKASSFKNVIYSINAFVCLRQSSRVNRDSAAVIVLF
jgi:hypothetical protein